VFEGVVGAGYQGDIAIDDVSTSDGPCLPPGSCDFESGMCTWTNDLTGDDFDWLRVNGATDSTGTGPTVDHTFGSDKGKRLLPCDESQRLLPVAVPRSCLCLAAVHGHR